MIKIKWTCKRFDSLSVDELYLILSLRTKVFIVEQNCAYQDSDGKDQASFHLTGWKDNTLVAYARLLPPGIAFGEASIGRVVTDPTMRGTGIGRELMEMAIETTCSLFDTSTIRIGAQLYLLRFYQSLRFVADGDEYIEDGIPHVEMIYTK